MQIEPKTVEEEFKQGDDVILIPMEVLVCSSCGERYYDRKTMKCLEGWHAKIRSNRAVLRPIGRVLKAAV
jgi:YgiT-type zinc finger domain-containing protein